MEMKGMQAQNMDDEWPSRSISSPLFIPCTTLPGTTTASHPKSGALLCEVVAVHRMVSPQSDRVSPRGTATTDTIGAPLAAMSRLHSEV